MLQSPAELKRIAAQCMALANRPETAPRRDLLVQIALQWLKVAKHIEQCERLTTQN